jgi:hypothetical protein
MCAVSRLSRRGRAAPFAQRRNRNEREDAMSQIDAMRTTLANRLMVGARVIALVLQFTMARDAAAQLPTNGPIPLMDRQREIALALSACPAAVAENAGIYALEPLGYVKVRDSRNGFNAIVQHSGPGAQEPQCMDAEGTRTILPRILKVADLRAQGRSAEEIKRIVADAFSRHDASASTTCFPSRTWYPTITASSRRFRRMSCSTLRS